MTQTLQPSGYYSYVSNQETNCAGCGLLKHTPLRIDKMGGYVCLTCIDKQLESLLDDPIVSYEDFTESVGLMLSAIGYTEEYARQWPKEKVSVTFKRWFDEQLEKARNEKPEQQTIVGWMDADGEYFSLNSHEKFGYGSIPIYKIITQSEQLEKEKVEHPTKPCFMCQGRGWYYMAHAYPPGMTAPETKINCTQCVSTQLIY